MARPRKGQAPKARAEWDGKRWITRVTILGDTRQLFELPFTAEQGQEAQDRANLLSELAYKLRQADAVELAPAILGKVASATEPRIVANERQIVDDIVAREWRPSGVKTGTEPTFADVANDWTSGKLAKSYPDHVRDKRTSDDDEARLRHVLDTIGRVPIARFTIDDADRAMRLLPAHLSRATRRHVAQVIRRVLELAVFPLRLREVNPLPKGWLPKLNKPKARAFLYPDEDAALMACEKVPFRRRVAYGFLAREGNRKSEGQAMAFDLKRGAVSLDRNKTDDARAWTLDPGVADALRAIVKLYGEDEIAATTNTMAELRGDELRADLEAAGVTRRELFEDSDVRDPFGVHGGLRGTFVTLALAAGRSEAWVTDRTGHTTSAMLYRYKRAARSVAEANLGGLVSLAAALPELRNRQRNRHKGEELGSEAELKLAITEAISRSGGMVDAADSKSVAREGVSVQVRPSVPRRDVPRARRAATTR